MVRIGASTSEFEKARNKGSFSGSAFDDVPYGIFDAEITSHLVSRDWDGRMLKAKVEKVPVLGRGTIFQVVDILDTVRC